MRTPSDKTMLVSESNGVQLPPPAYFLSLSVENLRCFGERQTLDLSNGNDCPRQWTILLGDNGVGKTTLLQCLTMLQPSEYRAEMKFDLPPIPNETLSPDSHLADLVHGRSKNANFRIGGDIFANAKLTSQENGIRIDRGLNRDRSGLQYHKTARKFLSSIICYGYGASRRMGTTSLSETQNMDTSASLFDDNAPLINAEEWLLQADYAAQRLEGTEQKEAEKRRDRIKEVLKTLLPDVSDLRFAPSPRIPMQTTVHARTPYGWVPIRDMSLGYRTLMAWMVDFASRLFERYPDSPDPLAEPAIALVDEIDLHLHPRWQRILMQFLSNIFPNTQFIASAHSPLVVQAATDANVVLLRRESDHVVIDNDVQAIKGWRIDQVLTSDLFNLESARPPQLDEALKERTRLLSKARLTARDRARLRKLEAQIGSLPTGETPQDIEAMDIIRRAADLLKKQE
jgi:predicted ATP-binding protein involved in virulence